MPQPPDPAPEKLSRAARYGLIALVGLLLAVGIITVTLVLTHR